MRIRLAVVSALAAVAGAAALARAEAPLPPLAGAELAAPAHLSLIVAASPAYVLDVDDDAVHPVSMPASEAARTLWLVPFRGGALALVDRYGELHRPAQRGVAIDADGVSRVVASGRSVMASGDGRSLLVLDRSANGRCTVRRVPGGGGRTVTPCGTLAGEGAAGIALWQGSGTVLVDARTGQVRARASEITQLGRDVVLEQRNDELSNHGRLSLVDLATGRRRALAWPSALGGFDGASVQPHGSVVAVAFADPAHPGPAQAEDLFLLDRRTGAFTRVPGFPAQLDLKRSSWAWSSDGRLVLLVRLGDTSRVGVYRPGDPAVALKTVQLPPPSGSSDTFVPLVSAG
jgi:hypothetical protein